MIHPQLHRQPVGVDRDQLRQTRIRTDRPSLDFTTSLNSIFLAASEFGDAARDLPIVFVNAGKDEKGQDELAPVAVLGVTQSENLVTDNNTWRARYMPAMLRVYPFCTARLDADRFAICIDSAWEGVSQTEGQRLFTDDGENTEFLKSAQQQLELLEAEIARTRGFCQRLRELDLVRDMRFDATLPDGRKHTVDGFFTVDQDRLANLPDATVLQLHKDGLLGLIHAHWMSLGNMQRLLEWHLQRHGAMPAVAANGAAPAA